MLIFLRYLYVDKIEIRRFVAMRISKYLGTGIKETESLIISIGGRSDGAKYYRGDSRVKYWILIVALLIVPFLNGCQKKDIATGLDASKNKEETEISKKVSSPYGAGDCIGKNKDTIQRHFMSAGFINVELEGLENLSLDDINKDGLVESVTINSKSDFEANQEFLNTSVVIVRYNSLETIATPISSDKAKTTEVNELKTMFSEAGFTNISSDEVFDLDRETDELEISNEVIINNNNQFDEHSKFPINSEIKIITHKMMEKYKLKVNVDFHSNLVFSTYDVKFEIADKQEMLLHGEDAEFEYYLKPGDYSITFYSADSNDVKGEVNINLTGDTEVAYKIKCFDDHVDVELLYSENKSSVGENQAMIPLSYDNCKHKNYLEIEKQFKDAGFVNIGYKILYDIRWGFTDEGEIEEVIVDGNTSFKRGEVVGKDVPVVLVYHMKEDDDPEKKENVTKETEEKKDIISKENQVNNNVLTIENNEDLANLLASKVVSADLQNEFINKYIGKVIEFNGIVMYLEPYQDYDYIYTYVLVPGEDETNIGAALFLLEGKGSWDFKWDSATRPEYLRVGSKIRLQAEVVRGEDPVYIYLKPVKTWGR